MNPPIDQIFDLFPVWFYSPSSSLDFCAITENHIFSHPTFERADQFHIDNQGQMQEYRFSPQSMLEEHVSNPAFPLALADSPPLSFIPPTPTPSINNFMKYDQEQESLTSPTSFLSSSSSSSFSTTYQKSSSIKRNTRVGFCEHPKHAIYRQPHSAITVNNKFVHSQSYPQHYHHHRCNRDNYCQKHICKKLCRHHHFLHHLDQQEEAPPDDTVSIANTPRRGRPPKGTKPSERLSNYAPTDTKLVTDHDINSLGSHPVENDDSNNSVYYRIAMTLRLLPKRLESVVGKSNIHVCLTCLKRSDMDVDYLMDPTYIGPQSSKKRKYISP